MEKFWFSVDGYRARLEAPVYDSNQGVRDEEMARTRKLLSDPRNDQQRIVLYIITDDFVRKMALIIDANKRYATPSYESANPQSVEQQKQETGEFLTRYIRERIESGAAMNLAFCKPTSPEEELSLEAKIAELERK